MTRVTGTHKGRRAERWSDGKVFIWTAPAGFKKLGKNATLWRTERVMSAAAKCVVLDTWAGRRYYAVEVVGETPKKARVRVLTPGGVMLPGRRYVQCGEVALVPKHAIYDMPAESHKIEQGYYDGHISGFGGTVDAR